MTFEMDDNVQSLLEAINSLPGLQTFSSCGGHPQPDQGQAPEGHFYVNFYLDPDAAGWDSLGRLAYAAAHFLGEEEEPGEFEQYVGTATITVWWNSDLDAYIDATCFEIAGNCSPEALSNEIRALRVAQRRAALEELTRLAEEAPGGYR